MRTLDGDCIAEYHEISPAGEYYHKIKPDANFLDWMFGTELDKTRLFLVVSCMHCGAIKEILCEDMNYPHREYLVETVVHEIPPEDK